MSGEPAAAITPAVSRPRDDPTAGFGQLANRIAKVQRERRKWAKRQAITCWRIYEKDLPDQPLIVDWYDGVAVVWMLDRTRNETPAQEDDWVAGCVAAVRAGLGGLNAEQVFLKRRRRQLDRQGGGQYQRSDPAATTASQDRTVIEGGSRFMVNLSDYLDTGLFLDHRPLRLRVRADAANKRVLNLFAYTGAFTVHARAGGAVQTTTVDLSNTYLEWAERNLRANDFANDPRHVLVRADATRWLASASGQWDIIVLDPPAFSNSTAMAGEFRIDRDHPALIAHCRRLLAPGGTLWFSSNLKGMTLSPTISGFTTISECSDWSVPEDFRNRRIHRCWQLQP